VQFGREAPSLSVFCVERLASEDLVFQRKLFMCFCCIFRLLSVLRLLSHRPFTTEARFDSRPVCVESMVNEMAVCCVFSGMLLLYTVLIIQSVLHTHVFATESI
jgi:hypothetical protein